MCSEIRGSAIEGTSDLTFGKKGLIVTFYAPRGEKARELHDELKTAFKEEVLKFDPEAIAAHDATIIQVSLTTSGDAATAWETMRQLLENRLTSEMSRNWWGYTLTYQAMLSSGVGEDEALKELQPAARRLHAPANQLYVLEQAATSGSRICLLGHPEGSGLAAASVYVALGPPDKAMALMSEVFYGPDAWLLIPDLIVHKACYVQRQYRGDDYKVAIVKLVGTADPLLRNLGDKNQLPSNSPQQERRQRQIDIGELLDDLTTSYYPVIRYFAYLSGLHTDLKRYLYNYGLWQAELADSRIIKHHSDYLKAIERDLEMLVTEARNALETADKALSTARAQIDRIQVYIDKAQERKQQRIQILIAMAALALALAAIVDRQTAEELLGLLPISESLKTWDTAGSVMQFIVILVTLIAITAPALLIAHVVRRVSKKWR